MITYQDYLDTLKTNIRNQKIKVELLRDDETVFHEITVDIEDTDGNLSNNNTNGARRSVNFTIYNLDGKYLPNFDGYIWMYRKFKLSMGLEINGEIHWESQGIYVVQNPKAVSNFSNSTIQINGIDKFSLLDGNLGGELDSLYQIPNNSPIYDVLKNLLVITGDNNNPILDSKFINEKTPYTIEKEAGTKVGDIIIELAKMLSANVYYDVDGNLVFERDEDDKNKYSEWDFSDSGDDWNYQGASYEPKFTEIYNSVKVIGDTVYGDTYWYKAQNNNLLSETSIPNLKRERTKLITDTNIYSDQLAKERAEYELKRCICMQSCFSITCIPMYHIKPDFVITLTDNNLKLNKERMIVQSYSIPLKTGGQMTIEAVKSIELLLEDD